MSHPWSQILTGVIPFPYESDEGVVEKVARGLRPERPSNHSQGMPNHLWEQIVACWNQEPTVRPTAQKLLLALGETEHRAPVESAGGPGDESILREWDWVEDDLEESTFCVCGGGPQSDI